MKTKSIFTLITLLISSSISHASDVIQVNLTGSVVATTCNVTTPTQTIYLGAWKTHSNSGIGSGVNSLSEKIPFTLNFDCPQGLNVIAQLDGNQDDPSNPFDIGIDKGEQSATGVVIELHYYSKREGIWKSFKYDEKRPIISNTKEGINTVQLRSFYRQKSPTITAGTANGSVTVSLTYN